LTPVYLTTTLMPDVPAATGNRKYTAHDFDTESSLMFFDEDRLYFRRFAKKPESFAGWPALYLVQPVVV
jgi:hypothetical protein